MLALSYKLTANRCITFSQLAAVIVLTCAAHRLPRHYTVRIAGRSCARRLILLYDFLSQGEGGILPVSW